MYIFSKIFIALFLLIFISCSNSQVPLDKLSEEINIIEIQAWLNLMPGGSASFHFVGEYEIDTTISKNLLLTNVIVLSDQKIIYDIDSSTLINERELNRKNENLNFKFYTQPGLKLNDVIKELKTIDVKLVFDYDGNEVEKIIKDVQLSRVY